MNKENLKKTVKAIVMGLFNLAGGFGFTYLLPLTMLTALNLWKGPVNNPDGETFILFGWLWLIMKIAIIVGFVVISIKISKQFKSKTAVFILLLMLIVIGMIVGAVVMKDGYVTLYQDAVRL